MIRYGEAFYPSLALQAARLYLGLAPDDVVIRLGEGLQIGERFLATDREMRFAVNHYGPAGSFTSYSLLDLLEGRVAPGSFTDRVVLIGSTALGTASTFASPFSRTLPAIEHHAAVVDNILHDRFLMRQDVSVVIDLLAVVLGSVATAALVFLCSPLLAGAGLAVLLVAWGTITTLALAWDGLWLSLVLPAAAMLLSFVVCGLLRSLAEGRQRRDAERQTRNLWRFVPASVASGLARRDPRLSSDQIQSAAVMFLDMVGFTTLNERMAPAEAMALLRAFHRRVERVVHAHGGGITQYVGDGAMACFSLPVPSAQDAGNAVACARALAADMEAWGRERAGRGEAPIRIGIGLHFGPVAVGEIGGEQQAQFTITGDTVNVASRLEALTRQHDTPIVASDAMIEAAFPTHGPAEARQAGFEPLPPQAIRGRAAPLGLWAWRGVGSGQGDDKPPTATKQA